MRPLRVLVFPCGSEIGLEVYASLALNKSFELVGCSSVDDHGRFVYSDYIGDIPFIDSADCISRIADIVQSRNIDIVYPTMDKVCTILKSLESSIGCSVVGPDASVMRICLSKSNTYNTLREVVAVPKVYSRGEEIKFPVFTKPDMGYGSRGAKIIRSVMELEVHLQEFPDSIILEYLPGREFTVDCFTDYNGKLLFVGPRARGRIVNGISVRTMPVSDNVIPFDQMASRINQALPMKGGWFFQIKLDAQDKPKLLEVGCRIAGSSGIQRIKGVNLAELSVYTQLGIPVDVVSNSFTVEVDRSLNSVFQISADYETVYFDFDDTILLRDKVNPLAVALIYQMIGRGKRVILLTKHKGNINETLRRYRLEGIFDEVIHLNENDSKVDYIKDQNSIFIDDSFSERIQVFNRLGIPVFGPDSMVALLKL